MSTLRSCPPELDVRPVLAVEPYREQIEAVNRQVGVIPPRETMKDASGASMMDPATQITRLHGASILDLATRPYEDNLVLALVREYPDETGGALANVVLNAYVNLHGTPMLSAAFSARESGNTPNTALCAALAMLGPTTMEDARRAVETLLGVFRKSALTDPSDPVFAVRALLADAPEAQTQALTMAEADSLAEAMLRGAAARGAAGSVFLRFLGELSSRDGTHPRADAVLAAVCCHLAWKPLLHKRISVTTMLNMP